MQPYQPQHQMVLQPSQPLQPQEDDNDHQLYQNHHQMMRSIKRRPPAQPAFMPMAANAQPTASMLPMASSMVAQDAKTAARGHSGAGTTTNEFYASVGFFGVCVCVCERGGGFVHSTITLYLSEVANVFCVTGNEWILQM